MLVATTAYVVCLVGIILMYIWYAPEASCLLNIFFITWTLVLLQLMTSVSLHPKVSYKYHSVPQVHSDHNLTWYNLIWKLFRWMLVSWLQGLWASMSYLYAGVPLEGKFLITSVAVPALELILSLSLRCHITTFLFLSLPVKHGYEQPFFIGSQPCWLLLHANSSCIKFLNLHSCI